MIRWTQWIACGVLCVVVTGCGAKRPTATPDAASTQPATAPTTLPYGVVDPETEPWYWLDKPAVAGVEASSFQALWQACRETARRFLFEVDREDPRVGLMMTAPQVSSQFFEPWRQDVGSVAGLVESSLATMRRTVHFRFERRDDDRYMVTPKVLVERQVTIERRVTSPVQYREAFTDKPPETTRERDLGMDIPSTYWLPVGRDEGMEKRLAAAIRARVADDAGGAVVIPGP